MSVRVYVDDGVDGPGAERLVVTIERCFSSKVVRLIDAAEILEGSWPETTSTLIIPGGRDLPYCQKLDGVGTDMIRAFVESGGRFVGICAGAYFAANECRFHEGDARGYEVVGPRQLAFHPSAAVGPALATYVYGSQVGARVALLSMTDAVEAGGSPDILSSYYNGGCYFAETALEHPTSRVLARYANEGPAHGRAAAVECRVGSGVAVLSGVHAEVTPTSLSERCASAGDKDPDGVAHIRDTVLPLLERAGGDAHADAVFMRLFGRAFA